MADRYLKAWHGEDLSPEYDLTDMAVWEECEFGLRAWNGESTSTTIVLRDEQSETSHADNLPGGLTALEYQARNVFEFGIGTDVVWRGRLANQNYDRGRQVADRARESSLYLEDPNIDFRGIVVHGWARPSESDVARVLALASAYMNGSPRTTFVVDTSKVDSGNTVTLAAKTYDQTDPLTIMQEIALMAGKIFYLLPRSSTSDSNTHQLVYDLPTSVVEACPFTITDDPATVAANPTTHFFPQWDVGSAAELNAQNTVSGIWLFYGMEAYVHAANPALALITTHWEEIISDDSVTTAADATSKANSIVEFRRSSERTINVSIGPLTDAQIVQIQAGQTIDIQAMAVPWADDQVYSALIGQLKVTSPGPGIYYAHMQLDRPLRLPVGNGGPIGPNPPTPPAQPGLIYSAITTIGTSGNLTLGTNITGATGNSLYILVQVVHPFGTPAVTTITYAPTGDHATDPNLQTATLVERIDNDAYTTGNAELWKIDNPVTGEAGASIKVVALQGDMAVGAFYATTTTIRDFAADTDGAVAAAGSSVTATSVSGDLVLDLGGYVENNVSPVDAPTAGGGQSSLGTSTRDQSFGQSDWGAGISSKTASGASTTMTWGFSASRTWFGLALVLTGTAGTVPEPIGGNDDGDPGDDPGTFAPIDHVHAHSDLSALTTQTHHHAESVEVTPFGTIAATNVQDALEEIVAEAGGGGAHATDHEDGGGDEIEIADLGTAETDTAKVLHPDGSGGVAWGTDATGGGSSDWDGTVVQATDQDVTNSAVLVDSDLQVSMDADSVYEFDFSIILSSNDTTGDFDWRFEFSSALTRNQKSHGYVSRLGSTGAYAMTTAVGDTTGWTNGELAFDTGGTLDDRHFMFGRFMVSTDGASAGTCTFRFANTAASPGRISRLHAGSVLRYRKLA